MSQDIEQSLSLARKQIESKNDDDARVLLLEILQKDANNRAALLMLGGSYFSCDKLSEAEMAFARLILIDPGCGKYSIALFNLLWKLERHEEALEEVKRFFQHADKDKEKETLDQYADIIDNIPG